MRRDIDIAALERAVQALPERFRGPGGVLGVVRDGRVIARQAWGCADVAGGLPMTVATRLPICSISKQFTSAVLLDVVGDSSRLDAGLAARLPQLQGRPPTVAQCCHMQSGLRDYWALTVPHGAHPEGVFRREDAQPLLARMRSTHFDPGSRYSYSNGNFRVLSDLLEEHAGRSLAELYASRLFGPAGMQTALLSADTGVQLDGAFGYEGNEQVGFFPAVNHIYWTGDAGICASLDDMLAWEQHIDATRDDAASLYQRLSARPNFSDGTPASYGWGLAHGQAGGVAVTGHSGALRGFRAHRLHAASQRLSVVVIFNHEANAQEAAAMLMRACLGVALPPVSMDVVPDLAWNGRYLDRENGLLLDIDAQAGGLQARYGTSPETLRVDAGGVAVGASMSLAREGDRIALRRPGENLQVAAQRLPAAAPGQGAGLAGRYFSAELDAWLEVSTMGASLSGRFEGLLGRGPAHAIYPAGQDVYTLSCQRSMDAPAPGDWTIQAVRGASGQVEGLTLGCWLARNIAYRRAD